MTEKVHRRKYIKLIVKPRYSNRYSRPGLDVPALISEICVINSQILLHFFQDAKAEAMTYAALDFSTRKVKRGQKKREDTPECVYSAVRADNHNQQRPSV